MSKIKKSFVKKQHYIPKFVLKNFQREDDKILFANIKQFPLKPLRSSPMRLMRENDFYEIKDDNCNYVFRNSIEDAYSSFEGNIKPNFQEFIDLCKHDDFQDKFLEIIENERWASIEASLLFHLIITLIRGKEVKNLVYSNSNLKDSEKDMMYLLFTTSQAHTVKFAKSIYLGRDLENILLFIKNSSADPLKELAEHIMSKYQIRVHKALGNKKFFLSDNPVIVQKFEDEDYHLPISPEICIGLIPLKLDGDKVLNENTIYNMSDEIVELINEQSVLNTDRLIIISKENDLNFISNIISRMDSE